MKISKTTLKQIIKEELEGAAAGKTYSFRIYKYRELERGLGDKGTFDFLEDLTFDQLDTEKYERLKDTHARPERFLKPKKEILAGVEGYNQYEHGVHLMTKPAESYPPKGEYIKSWVEWENEERSKSYTEGIKTMKITKTRLKEIIKEELENVLEGVEKAWCVGFEKDGEMHHERVYADAGGIAERKIKKKHDISDDAIKSTKEGECKR